MMTMRTKAVLCLGLVGTMSLAATGCVVAIGGAGCTWGCGTMVWTDKATETLSIGASGLETLEVRTHNGKVDYTASTDSEVAVTVTKMGGGLTRAAAEDAMDAIDVYVESVGDGVQRLAWRWKGIKGLTWKARVSFSITGPSGVALDLETHNGAVGVSGAASDVTIVTHNGGVNVSMRNGKLRAETHNGRITADYEGGELTLFTHNGRIKADLSRCGSVRGDLTTHNGTVELTVGDATSAALRCDTHNGRISTEVPITEGRASRKLLEGKLGQGGETLVVSTHNGSIRIKKSDG